MAEATTTTKGGSKALKPAAKKSTPRTKKETTPMDNRTEAKSRFNAALDEARAGAAALRAEAGERAGAYREQARARSSDLIADVRTYSGEARVRVGELAVEGKTRVSDGLASLGKVVADTAPQIDERLGEQYGDYARRASRGLQEASAKLDAKSVEQIGEDAREMVRKSPGIAVGLAAIAGFLIARLFGGRRG